jgi:hypothetical protein
MDRQLKRCIAYTSSTRRPIGGGRPIGLEPVEVYKAASLPAQDASCGLYWIVLRFSLRAALITELTSPYSIWVSLALTSESMPFSGCDNQIASVARTLATFDIFSTLYCHYTTVSCVSTNKKPQKITNSNNPIFVRCRPSVDFSLDIINNKQCHFLGLLRYPRLVTLIRRGQTQSAA